MSKTTTVNLAALLDRLEEYYRAYIVPVHSEAIVSLVLWTAHTWVFEAADSTPYIHVTAPVRQAGKSRVGEVAELVVRSGWRAIMPTPAVLFRKIHIAAPTLILDETDRTLAGNIEWHQALIGVLNGGYERGMVVPRMSGGNNATIQEFNVFCPKMIIGIGSLPDTVASRSVPFLMRRRLKTEAVERFRARDVKERAKPIAEALTAWAKEDVIEKLRDSAPELPDALNDRAQDIWEPLLAIADMAGDGWPVRGREAALALMADSSYEDEPDNVRLLADIRSVFRKEEEKIHTAMLLARLKDDNLEAPWENVKLNSNRLASMLRGFGVKSRRVRIGGRTGKVRKGYFRSQFRDAWRRYLPKE